MYYVVHPRHLLKLHLAPKNRYGTLTPPPPAAAGMHARESRPAMAFTHQWRHDDVGRNWCWGGSCHKNANCTTDSTEHAPTRTQKCVGKELSGKHSHKLLTRTAAHEAHCQLQSLSFPPSCSARMWERGRSATCGSVGGQKSPQRGRREAIGASSLMENDG